MSWHQAQDECTKWGGNLVTIRSPYENTYFLNQLKGRSIREAWIGLNDEKVEGEFVWVSGAQNFFTNWNALTHEPSGGRSENCGEIITEKYWNGAWNDLPCGYQRNFVCERMV